MGPAQHRWSQTAASRWLHSARLDAGREEMFEASLNIERSPWGGHCSVRAGGRRGAEDA